MAGDCTIIPSSYAGRKSQKSRFTFLACCNPDGTYRFPLIFWKEHSKASLLYEKTGEELWLHFRNSQKTWINSSLFFEQLLYVDRRIGSELGRKILFLLTGHKRHFPIFRTSKMSSYPLAYPLTQRRPCSRLKMHHFRNESEIPTISDEACCRSTWCHCGRLVLVGHPDSHAYAE